MQEFELKVRVRVEDTGRVSSNHDYASLEDQAKAQSLPGGGLRHIAHAFLMEAYRRETFVCCFLAMTQDADFLRAYRDAPPEKQTELEADLGQKARKVMLDTTGKIGVGVAREILKMLVDQMPPG